MSNEVQDYYISQLERITKKYLYSVNRAKTRKDKYDAKGFYDLNFNSRWKSIIYKFSHTYHIEFLGKKMTELRTLREIEKVFNKKLKTKVKKWVDGSAENGYTTKKNRDIFLKIL